MMMIFLVDNVKLKTFLIKRKNKNKKKSIENEMKHN